MKISSLTNLYLLAVMAFVLGCNVGMSTSDEGPETASAALTEEEPEAEEESVETEEPAERRRGADGAERQTRESHVRLKVEMGEDLLITDEDGEAVEEGVDVESFTASLTEKLDSREFKTCFKDAVEADKDLEGSFKLQLTVTEEGGIAEPTVVESTFEDEEISTCMTEAMGEWTFEGHEGEEPFTAVQTINLSTEEVTRENAREGGRDRERGDQANARGNQRGNSQRGNNDGNQRGNSQRGNNNGNQRGNNDGNQRGNSQRGNNNGSQQRGNGNQQRGNGNQRGGR